MGEPCVNRAGLLLFLYIMEGLGVMLWFAGYTSWGREWRFKVCCVDMYGFGCLIVVICVVCKCVLVLFVYMGIFGAKVVMARHVVSVWNL